MKTTLRNIAMTIGLTAVLGGTQHDWRRRHDPA